MPFSLPLCAPALRAVIRYALVLSILAPALAGCVTGESSPARELGNDHGSKPVNQSRANILVEEARQMLEQKSFNSAIPRLLEVTANYPNTTAAVDARYWLGVAYYRIQSYQDSIQVFEDYLKAAPNGQYAEAATSYLEQQRVEYQGKYPTADQLSKDIDALMQEVRNAPEDVTKQLRLASLFWELGDYDNAGRLYEAILKVHPEYENDLDVKARIERLPNGGYILLTPTEIQRREREFKPVEVFNLNSFRSGEDIWSRQDLYYSVSGQVMNRSTSVLYGVQVIVTIYGLGNVVYDTQNVSIGRLSPGETRAFSVRLSNFDNIENVQRYECTTTFER